MFGRGRGAWGRLDPAPTPSPGGDRPDPNLPMLTVDEAAWLLALVRRAFAEQGRETVGDGAGALRGDGQVYGLHNLAAHAAGAARRAWPDLARRHVLDMLAADRTPEPESLDEVRDQVMLKLRPLSDLPGGPPAYAPEVLPGVVAVAAIDYPTHVSELLDADRLEPLGGWGVIRPVALENLRRLEAPRLEALEADEDRPDSVVNVMLSEDFFGAARICVLDTLLASLLGIERPEHGVLVAVPNRHVLAIHIPSGPGLIAALQLLVTLATEESTSAPGPISPYVYLMAADGRIEQVTRRGDDGDVVIEVRGALAEVFERLGLLGDGDGDGEDDAGPV